MSAFGKWSGGKASDMLGAMRASADGAPRRLSGGGEPRQSERTTQDFAPLDPTRALFPNEEETPEGETPRRAAPLQNLLGKSAFNLERLRELLGYHAALIASATADRAAGEKSLTIWGWRAAIGVLWLAAGVWLNQAALNARAEDLAATVTGGVPIADAEILSRVFLAVGTAGIAAAMVMIFWVFAAGNGDNRKLRRRGEAFGGELAGEIRELNETLKARRDMVVEGPKSARGLSAASQCHLEGLEACSLFGQIPFLTASDPEDADAEYLRFLHRFAPPAPGYGFGAVLGFGLLSVAIGVLAGWIAGFARAVSLYNPDAAIVAAEPVVIAMMAYPLAAQALLFGGLLYLLMGLVIEAFSGVVGRGEMARARRDALDAMRSAYVAQEAPLETELVRQVEDVVEILRAQLGVGGARAGLSGGRNEDASANHAGAFSPEDEVPEWRRRDSSVKFVETGFSAAPSSFRTDAFAKKFSGSGERETGSKRGGEGLKNRSRD
ncbi:hypothetical protein [Hyphococcus luteus]|uniref:Uncharacterized protein n=1 Tax=Hyphococcus luteus TaxID=2058213 RepID=A0A2S7KAU9_9PROT|nr:hypothetical protein [Marinicaulis flavus]PQA89635.1 hypothetical protein CW354_01860 [Marinicaulis flavus]